MKRIVIVLLMLSLVGSASAETVHTFVSPDCSFSALSDFIEDAESSLVVASYTFGSPEIAGMLIEKADKGLRVSLMVDKSPVGGISESENEVLCALADGGVTVMLYDGPLRFMHAKYIIRDGADSLVTSENFGYSGFYSGGSYGNRGWGVITDGDTAKELTALFAEDLADSVPFACPLDDYTLDLWSPRGAYEPVFETDVFEDQEVRLIHSPDSLDEILELIRSAEEQLIVQEFYIYTHWGSASGDTIESAPSPVLDALLEKAREGVPVTVMVDSTYYQMDRKKSVSNYNTIEYINSLAVNESLPIEAKPADISGLGMATMHNKGLIADGKKVLVSSINWNENSIMNNREVGLVIEGEAAGYYLEVFGFDSGDMSLKALKTDDSFLPAMLSLAALLAVILYLSARKLRKRRVIDL